MDFIRKFEPLFGDWHVESFIGAGSFGRVYKIYRDEMDRRYYSALKYISIPAEESEVKQLRADGMDNISISNYYGNLMQNISSEITLMNRLKGNTNVISFEDSRITPKPNGIGYDIFIRMELLESLTNRIAEHQMEREEVVKLGKDLCNALILCAKNKIIHRDIKPDNIFISPNGDYKLGDFGIARQLEKTATFMSKKGTYNYMAPEVYKGERYGAACDIYSLGLVMYRLLNNGRLPFLPPAPKPMTPDDKENAIIRRMKGESFPAPCNAGPALGRIILKACAYDPRARYQSAAEMLRDLEHPESIMDGGREDAAVWNGSAIGSGTGKRIGDTEKTVSAQGTVFAGVQTDRERTEGTEATAWNRVFCPYCGKPQKSGNKFCASCGKPIYTPEKTRGDEAQKIQTPTKKKDLTFFWVILALILMIVIAASVIVITMTNKNRGEDTEGGQVIDVLTPTPKTVTESPAAQSAWVTEPPVSEPAWNPDPPTSTPTQTPTPTPTRSPTPTPTRSPSPTPDQNSFYFGGVEIDKNTTEIVGSELGINGSSSNYRRITKEEVNNLVKMCPNLTKLSLSYCYMDSYEPLKKLTKLEVLDLKNCGNKKGDGNRITDIDWVSSLKKLKQLRLEGNAISDLTPLEDMDNLHLINLSNNELDDESVKSVAKIRYLEDANLYNNKISDFSPLVSLQYLRYLNIHHTNISSISFLKKMSSKSLRILYVGLNYKGEALPYFDWEDVIVSLYNKVNTKITVNVESKDDYVYYKMVELQDDGYIELIAH